MIVADERWHAWLGAASLHGWMWDVTRPQGRWKGPKWQRRRLGWSRYLHSHVPVIGPAPTPSQPRWRNLLPALPPRHLTALIIAPLHTAWPTPPDHQGLVPPITAIPSATAVRCSAAGCRFSCYRHPVTVTLQYSYSTLWLHLYSTRTAAWRQYLYGICTAAWRQYI